ncbi:MAG: hypothetical protein J6T60_16085 [Bacteroidales bacterium]|nr:hypothetical protein [Bacteroidales bacterium]
MGKNEKKIIGNFFMWVLIVANLIAFCFQPSDFSIFNHAHDNWSAGLFTLMMIPVVFGYAVSAIVGIILLTKNLHSILTCKENDTLTKVTVFALLFSLLAIGYGTFLKKQPSMADLIKAQEDLKKAQANVIADEQWDNENVLLKYGSGERIYRRSCIVHGDTIIFHPSELKIDTLVLDKSSNTCHWTYKPMVDYRITYFNDSLFTQDAADKSFSPLKYDERIQYVINQVNNKHEDEFDFYFMDGVDDQIKNDTIMCFLFKTSKYDATERLGYLYFSIDNNVAVLKDSCSDIYRLINYPKDKDYRERAWWASDEYDLPLLRSQYRKEKLTNNDFIQYDDYFDILQKKPVIVNCPVWIEYWDTTAKSLNYTTTKFESRQKDFDYPILDYYTTFRAHKHSSGPPDDTLEKGRYVMRNGKYVKEVYYKKE